MQYRPLGQTGLMVSSLCLGAMNFGSVTPAEEGIAIIDRVLDAGVNFIDTADVYGKSASETVVGQALARGGKRDGVIIATKVGNATSSAPADREGTRYHIISACENSLRRLQTDHIDLYQLHRPSPGVPQEETLRAFDDLIRAGKVRYIGCSNHPAWGVMEALSISEREHIARYVSEQPPYSLLDRRVENELIPLAQQYGLGILPWSPLAGGILAGRYDHADDFPADSRAQRGDQKFRDRVTERGIQIARQVGVMAQQRGLSTAQLALLWVKDQPGVTAPVFGVRTMAHAESALGIADLSLADEDRPLFDALVHPGNVVADFHNNIAWVKARVLD